jgi:hypothetical protein
MKLAADSSAIVRLYEVDQHTATIERFLSNGQNVVSLSQLARLEILNVLLRSPGDEADDFLRDVGEGRKLRLDVVNWDRVWVQSESLARRFAPRLKPGGHDLVLVAAAVTMGADWFLSFDYNSRQRPLAAAAGLKVWPPLSKDEKGLARHP